MEKSLDRKVAKLLADPNCGEFILADAKDADMAGGLASAGKSPEHHAAEGKFRSLAEYRALIKQNIDQGLIDIMLMSASTSELLTIEQRLFDNSHVTPAIRANDTSDIWLATGSRYAKQPARPFRTATIDHAMCGKVSCEPSERKLGADLGLFSMTFNNDLDLDYNMLAAFKAFREEAEAKGFRYFLEVFDPNACGQHCLPEETLGRFIADNITRALAGVTKRGRPVFLKIAYHGPAAMEALASYDRSIIPGILGGASGTTFDAFEQLKEARKYGARAALYGRMINNSEHQLTFIQHLRWIADGKITDAADAVRSYHSALGKLNLKPYRPLEQDVVSTLRGTSYAASGGVKTVVPAAKIEAKAAAKTLAADGKPSSNGKHSSNGKPDFAAMTPADRLKYYRDRLNRSFH
jgi:hypothetical protein